MTKTTALAAWYTLDALTDSFLDGTTHFDIDALGSACEAAAMALSATHAVAVRADRGDGDVADEEDYEAACAVAHEKDAWDAVDLDGGGEVPDEHGFVVALNTAWEILAPVVAAHEATAAALAAARAARLAVRPSGLREPGAPEPRDRAEVSE